MVYDRSGRDGLACAGGALDQTQGLGEDTLHGMELQEWGRREDGGQFVYWSCCLVDAVCV